MYTESSIPKQLFLNHRNKYDSAII